jgi:hypothetical protein
LQIWFSANWILLLVFHNSSIVISIAETIYEMCAGVFSTLITAVLQHNTGILA